MTTPEFSFSVRELDASGKHVQLPVRVAWLRGVLEGTSVTPTEHDGDLDLRASRSGTDVIIHGTVRAELSVPCSRCLNPARVSIHETVSALAVPGAGTGAGGAGNQTGAVRAARKDKDAEDEDEIEPEEADILTYEGEIIVLDDLVRDELLLGIPMIPLCSEACPGIRPKPLDVEEAGPSIDPRLAPLLKFQQKT